MSQMEPVTEEAAPETNKPGAYISARHRQDAVLKPVKAAGNDTLAGICAIIATLVYVLLLFMLYSDFKVLGVA